MALTDNTMTEQELETAATANPELLKVVTGYLAKKEYSVRDKTQETEYASNLEKKHVSDYTAKTAPMIEKTIKDLTGIDKVAPDEKWYDYTARATKSLVEKSTAADARIKELESKSNLSETERQQLQQLTEYQTSAKTEIETLKTNHQKELTVAKIENSVLASIAPYQSKFKPEIPKVAIDAMNKAVISEILSMGKKEGDITVFVGTDGKTLLDKNAAPMTAAAIYEDRMKDFIDTGKQAKGAGGGQEPDAPAIEGIPSSITTQVELAKWLTSQGKLSGTKEYSDIFNKYSPKLARR